jgi:hypothetical protein
MAVAPTYVAAIPGGVHIPGDRKEFIWTGTVGAADTYVTSGFASTPAQVGLQVLDYVSPVCFSTGHFWGVYVPSTGFIKVFSAAATELANASTALQSATFVVEGLGH